jgi:CRP/FNR family transcriptional regulator, cyclic AMP receptor protein
VNIAHPFGDKLQSWSVSEFFATPKRKSSKLARCCLIRVDIGSVMYVISAGEVNIAVSNQVVETAGPGSIVGEVALIDAAPRSASAVAKTDCDVVVIDQHRFEFLVQQTPYFALEVMQIMADRLRRADQLISR